MPHTRITILFHPIELQSYELVKALKREGYIGQVDLLPAFSPHTYIKGFPWSTPSLYSITGEPLALAPLTIEETLSIIEGEEFNTVKYNDEDLLTTSIHRSTYASALALLWGSFKPLLYNCRFLEPALRLRLRKIDCSNVQSKLESRIDIIYERSWKSLATSLSYSIVRDYYVIYGSKLDAGDLERLTYPAIYLWLVSKASVGLVGMPMKITNSEVVDYMSEYISWRSYSLLESVHRDMEKILGDKEYMMIVASEARWFYPYLTMNHNI